MNNRGLPAARRGFTLIELLITIAIIGILSAVGLTTYPSVQRSARDASRKSDLELIRSGLELYKSDCNSYPATANFPSAGNPLNGNGSSCSASNIYISSVPIDPKADRNYSYNKVASGYIVCAVLEKEPSPAINTANCASCGSLGCNYAVINP